MNSRSPKQPSSLRTVLIFLIVYTLLTSQLAAGATVGKRSLNSNFKSRDPEQASEVDNHKVAHLTQFEPVVKPLEPLSAPLAVNIIATKTDNRTVAQPAAPGDTINYTVTIQNSGSTDATNVTFTDTIDANTTLVPNSIVSTPLANNDTYNVIGNVRIQPNAAQGLLANDFNPDNGNATGITAAGPTTSTNGGNVTVNADGSFSYNPPVGFAGTDTFTYTLTVTATGKTDTATVTLNVGNGTATPGTNVIWFINSAAAPGGDGRLTSPFNCFVGAGCFSAVAADDPGDTIFLFNGAYTGGYSLLANQKLIGQGAGATLESISGVTVQAYSNALPATNGNPDNVTMTTVAAATNALTVSAGGILLRGFTIGNTTGAKIFGSSFGTLTAGNTSTPDLKLNGTGQALNLTTGTFAATSAFTSVATTSSATQGITLAGVGGTVAFGSTTVSGATTQGILVGTTTANINFGNTSVTGGGDAIALQNNSAGTRTFGTVTTSGNTGIGFSHTAAGGITTVTGATTITNPGGTGISIQNSTTAISFAGTTVNKGASSGTGVDLGNNTGNTTFNSLSITTSNGTGLLGVGNTGQINVTTNAGSISSTSGPAINISKAAAPATPITLNFGTVSSTNSTTLGVNLDRVSGNLTNTTTTTTNPTGVGIHVLNSGAGTLNFGNTTSNTSAGAGVSLATNAGGVTFVDLDIAPDANVVSFSAANNTGVTSSSTGTISTTDAPAISVTNSPLSMTLTSVTADNTGDPDSCVSLTTASGTLNMQGGTLTGGTGAAFLVSGGSPTVTYSGSITQNSAARVVDIQNTTANTITFNTGTITGGSSSTGININAANGSVTFANGLTLGTSVARMTNQAVTITGGTGTYSLGAVSIFTTGASAQGIAATNADGTLNCTSGVVNTVGGRAINIDGPAGLTTLGMTFTTVSANGGANGISIQDTNGTFTVAGSGGVCTEASPGTCSGGQILALTGADTDPVASLPPGTAVALRNATNISLTRIRIDGSQNYGIHGFTVTNFTLANSVVHGVNGTNVSSPFRDSSIRFDQLTGTNSITNSLISGGFQHNLLIDNQSGTAQITVSGNTIKNTSAAVGDDGFQLEAETTAVVNAFVTNNSFSAHGGDHFNLSLVNTADVDVTFTGNAFAGGHAVGLGQGLFILGAAFNGTFNYDISNNGTAVAPLVGNRQGGMIHVNKGSGTATFSGRIQNNFIGNAAIANSGSLEAFGIIVGTRGAGGSHTTLIDGNTVRQYEDRGIVSEAGEGGAALNATITNNTVSNFADAINSLHGIHSDNGINPTDTNSVCMDIRANSVATAGNEPQGGADIRLRKGPQAGLSLRIPGLSGTTAANAQAKILADNPTATTVSVTGANFAGGAACTQPTLPAAPSPLSNFDQSANVETALLSQKPSDSVEKPQTEGARAISVTVATAIGVATPVARVFVPEAGARGKVETSSVKSSETKHEGKESGPKERITPNVAVFPLTIGTLAAGKSVTVTFSVTVNNPVPPGTTQVSNQGTVSGNDGATSFNILTDDPDVAGTNNPTVTGITPPPDIFIRDGKVGEPVSGQTSMLFTVALSAPAPGSVSVNFATANGGGTPASGGAACNGTADYLTTNGTVNFIAGQQLQTVSVPVCADTTVEGDETFLVNLTSPTNGIIADGQATGTITPNAPGTILISELRTSGPGGAGDDFVELYNNTDSPVDVSGYGLFKMGAACADTPVLIGTIPNSTTIPARGHYLFVGSAYSLANYGGAGAAAGNLTLSSNIEADRNVALFTTATLINISSDNRRDAVGFGTNTGGNCDLLREGTNLQTANDSTSEYSFLKKLASGTPQDTNDNSADFVLISTTPTVPVGANAAPLLGGAGPENLSATTPLQRNATIKASLVDPGVASTALPNRERIQTPDVPNNSTFGTLDIRRKFTNNTGGMVTRLRFRIVDITTFPVPGGTADLRARTSGQLTLVPISGGGTVTIEGTTVEIPPAQPNGGGLNTTMTVTTGVPIAPGAPINVRFLLGVQQNGGFRFFINVEALP